MADRSLAPARRTVAPALALLLSLGPAGCGGPDEAPTARASRPASTSDGSPPAADPTAADPPGATPAVDPCVLVTRAEAERLAGTPLGDGRRAQDLCTYVGPVTGPTAQVEVFVDGSAKNLYDGERQLGHRFEPVAGIGDEAHIQEFAIFFRASGRWVGIRLVRTDTWTAYRARMEATARAAAARI